MALVNRFPTVGQNTPLTCVYMNGWEFGSALRDGVSTLGTYTYQSTTPDPHQNGGYGGSQYAQGTTNSVAYSATLPALKEFVLGVASYMPAGDVARMHTYYAGGSSFQLGFELETTGGTAAVLRNTTTLATSAGGVIPSVTWNWIHLWGKVSNTGFAQIRVGSYPNLVCDSGVVDTQDHASVGTFDLIRWFSSGASNVLWDDTVLFARSMYYSAGSGTAPVAAQTLTGATSGATCTIETVFNTAGAGCLFISGVTGTFEAGETINNGIGWTATAGNDLGNDEASLWVPEQYIKVFPVVSDLATGWTNSTGGNHFGEVDDLATTTDYISTDTVDQTDEFDVNVTLFPGGIVSVLGVSAYAQLNGVSNVNNIRVGINDGLSDMDSPDSVLTGAWDEHAYLYTTNPSTGLPFTSDEISALTLRLISKA